ncbi:hypothetical protein BATDEDRAFT_87326 [Batrachochytrium dendrobatidis JAM81]|uniref:Uncharacterized protein n=2 Tax=Batrachochytrium dendrobatidis TaxID=109871 RepID=F4NY99_BATDJ|nr:uncharacterized protein BATDEDRAFT_87326 [Batrachochytrium dendrobatidis JAM81]EGF81980.1 hypothetical protein BATDEDRAFT_87326 [Batrachochytrium dendrobatidis JAM81]OAJ40765.1 hypothetical protein BDEG_24465 [Batrachochytrium dendrobatidis JEL423]|eukprot:XP_006677593.1 hypothetical protein BATDEDRAFT_87326 [Batrachochytrium dendrobatidis JAM81]
MKLVDILFVLTAAATVNAILIPADNDGSPQASSTFNQVSDPTNEPNPEIPVQDWQSIIDAINSSIFDENWQNIFDPIDPSTSDKDWQNVVDQPSSSTSSQVSDPTDQVGSSNFDKDQQPADQPSSGIPDQTQQQPIDQPSPSTSKRSRKRPINEISSGTSKRGRKQPIDKTSSGTPKQSRKRPMGQGESANTVTNQVIVLSQKYQRTFDRMKKRLVESKEIRDEKWQECREYAALRFEQWSGLERGEEISGSRYDPDTEKKLKHEYEQAGNRVRNVRHKLKAFMKKHGLEFEELGLDLN